jgi:hypothetical protein
MKKQDSPASASLSTDLIPRCHHTDFVEVLTWWLANPLLLYHYPQRMAATAALVEGMTPDERKRCFWKLRETRSKARATKALPVGLPELERQVIYDLLEAVEDAKERSEVRTFAQRLHPCELPWLAEQLQKALAARAEAITSAPDYQH